MNRHQRPSSLVITITVVGLVGLGSLKQPTQPNNIYVSTQTSNLNGQPEPPPAAALSKLKPQTYLFNPQPAFAQSVSPRDVWRQVYKQLPDLPLENQYVDKETGKVDSENTLANRLIGYHIYVKGRAPNYRLDWKLTLADYLGANELILEEVYPGFENLRSNPLIGDRTTIERLSRQQRDALVQTLVNIFNPNYSTPAKTPPQPSTAPSPNTTNSPQPRPGDAQLLMP